MFAGGDWFLSSQVKYSKPYNEFFTQKEVPEYTCMSTARARAGSQFYGLMQVKTDRTIAIVSSGC